MSEDIFDLRKLLSYTRRKTMSFSEYVDVLIDKPEQHFYTSSMLISEAIEHFGYKVSIRSGEPVVSYNIFRDIFSNGVNAVYGQDMSIRKLVSVIDSISKESGPNRGIVLLGPPASGKTNIIDLIAMALEEYSKAECIKLYSFYYHFTDDENPEKVVEIRSSFTHNPVLLFTTILHQPNGIKRPRQELLEHINRNRKRENKLTIPTYYQNASLDKRNLDIIESLLTNPRNHGKTLYDIFEEYIRVEEIEFSNAQALGVSNIDSMHKLETRVKATAMRDDSIRIINQHVSASLLQRYEGALVSANRGVLHIHDAFSDSTQDSYRPLLMLLGSGKVSLENSQTSVDTVVVITTNLEDMDKFDRELTATKLLDRIEKIPVNYLLDATSEVEILKRDMSIIKEKYDVDPNLFNVASYFSVMTRLLPPSRSTFPDGWSQEKKDFYLSLSPEQKMFIYASQPTDPIATIRSLPYWHPFRNQAAKLGLDLYDEEQLRQVLSMPEDAPTLETCGVFTSEQVSMIDDSFKRELRLEYELEEGRLGISIRQLQNIMRNTISNSDGRAVLVGAFISELEKVVEEGSSLHHWLKISKDYKRRAAKIEARHIGEDEFIQGEGDYGDFKNLVRVVTSVYHLRIANEIVTATVDRDPSQTEADLRKYIQSALLAQAVENKAFSHIMVPRYAYVDPVSGEKVERPDLKFMETIEDILCPGEDKEPFRKECSQAYFEFTDSGKLKVESGKNLMSSNRDTFLKCFEKEYNNLLSHRITDGTIDGRSLSRAFFYKRYNPEDYLKMDPETRTFTETVLHNMTKRYGYSNKIALETIVYALRGKIVDFSQVLN